MTTWRIRTSSPLLIGSGVPARAGTKVDAAGTTQNGNLLLALLQHLTFCAGCCMEGKDYHLLQNSFYIVYFSIDFIATL